MHQGLSSVLIGLCALQSPPAEDTNKPHSPPLNSLQGLCHPGQTQKSPFIIASQRDVSIDSYQVHTPRENFYSEIRAREVSLPASKSELLDCWRSLSSFSNIFGKAAVLLTGAFFFDRFRRRMRDFEARWEQRYLIPYNIDQHSRQMVEQARIDVKEMLEKLRFFGCLSSERQLMAFWRFCLAESRKQVKEMAASSPPVAYENPEIKAWRLTRSLIENLLRRVDEGHVVEIKPPRFCGTEWRIICGKKASLKVHTANASRGKEIRTKPRFD